MYSKIIFDTITKSSTLCDMCVIAKIDFIVTFHRQNQETTFSTFYQFLCKLRDGPFFRMACWEITCKFIRMEKNEN